LQLINIISITTLLHLMRRLRMCRAVRPLPQHPFMGCNWNSLFDLKKSYSPLPMVQQPPSGQGPSHYQGLTITFRHTTLGGTLLDE